MYISGRERKILEFLLNQQDDVTIKHLADSLEVSSRTIHRDLKSVEDILEHFQLNLNKKSGVGIQIVGDKVNKKNLELTLFSVEHTDYRPEERQAIIISTLLETNEPIKLFTLANELDVTIATVSNDLDKIADQLSEYQIELIRKRGYGVSVEGKETSKRAALSYLISQHMDESDFVALLRENIEKKSKQHLNTISSRLLGLVDQNKLKTIEKSVERIRSELPYELADSAYIGLVVHLALAIERLQQGENIQFDQNYLRDMKETKEYQIAEKMIFDLEKAFGMIIPEDEIGYITMHLMGAKLRNDNEYLLEESSIDIAYKARELISYVGEQLGKNLTDNSGLLSDLVAHLKPTIYRLKQGMNIKNPLLREIKEDYQQLFTMLEDGVGEVFSETEFPDEEIGYLVLHFASALMGEEENVEVNALVICSSGIGTSRMLASRLNQHIPEVKQVSNRSLFELSEMNLSDYDLIISTIPLKDMENEYILASPILTEKEIHKIKRYVRRLKVNKRAQPKKIKSVEVKSKDDLVTRLQSMQQYSKVILDLLLGLRVYHIEEKKDSEEIMEVACFQLEKNQVINDKEAVFQELIKREKLGGLGIPGTSLALYHARSDSVRKPILSVYALDHPIAIRSMDDNEVRVESILLMLAPRDISEQSLELLSFISALLIRDQESISTFQSKDENKINQYLSHHLNEFINQKL
ncbi:PRD domain-containing protein [Aquibacillus halophilus]|uniref:PRD domain-containing protein n=1 Tax=Aquibacillus halophilus TaxID=930132 RepID=A0A6A8DIJ9_9BACI|nr:BglG family transcription antiterminator [Aquibacillus halophilus]MRH44286.1 PRD domain-containing protein [Aquibacillus halophilus]